MKLRAALVLVVLALAGSVATSSAADDASAVRGTVACTPQFWSPGCTTPLGLAGLIHLLGSPAAALAPLQFLAGHYVVSADDCATNLGSWAKADGLDGPSEVTLTRAASAESLLVQAWLNGMAINPQPSQVTITLVSGLGQPLQTWQLRNVLPLSWTIEAFDPAPAKLAIETLELSYERLAPGIPC
jgi:hypothetical protein